MKKRTDLFRFGFIVCLLFITTLSILPDTPDQGVDIPHLTESGFFMHALAWGVAAWLGLLAFSPFIPLLFLLFLYSALLECVQLAIPWRSFNYWDIVANLVGIALIAAGFYGRLVVQTKTKWMTSSHERII